MGVQYARVNEIGFPSNKRVFLISVSIQQEKLNFNPLNKTTEKM
jgi:hypothetical protein